MGGTHGDLWPLETSGAGRLRIGALIALTLLALTLAGAGLAGGRWRVVPPPADATLYLSAGSDGQFRFRPADLRAAAGTEVTLVYANPDAVPHDFVLEDGDVTAHIAVLPGKTATIRFPAPQQSGSYTFYCNLPGHREAGMAGTLLVTPRGAA